jgi:hypothetical protein
VPVTSDAAMRLVEQPATLVVPQRLEVDPCCGRDLAGAESWVGGRLARSVASGNHVVGEGIQNRRVRGWDGDLHRDGARDVSDELESEERAAVALSCGQLAGLVLPRCIEGQAQGGGIVAVDCADRGGDLGLRGRGWPRCRVPTCCARFGSGCRRCRPGPLW